MHLRHLLPISLFSALAAARRHGSSTDRVRAVPIRPGDGNGVRNQTVIPIPPDVVDYNFRRSPPEQQFILKTDSESFYHGLNGNHSNHPISNLTVYTNGIHERILSLGRLDGLLDWANCTDHSIRLQFLPEVEFQKIRQDWEWVNTAQKNYIIFVTTNSHCDRGPHDPGFLQPWHVSEAHFDSEENSIKIVAEPKEPKEAFQNWHLQANSKGILPDRPAKRGFSSHGGMVDVSVHIPQVGYGFGSGLIIQDTVIGTQKPGGSILCDGCTIHGSLHMKFDIQPDWRNIIKGEITISSHGINALMRLNASVYGAQKKVIDHRLVVYAAPVPAMGLFLVFHNIRLFEVGLGVELLLRAGLGGNPEPVALSAGYNITLADESEFKLDLSNPKNIDASGWNPRIEAVEPAFSDGISITGKMGQEMRLVLALEDIISGGQAGFIIGGGTLNVRAKGVDEKPACGQESASRGVELQLDVAEEVGAFVSGRAYFWGKGKTFTLASTATPLYSQCMPITRVSEIPQPTHMPTPILQKFLSETVGPLGTAASAVNTATSKVESVAHLVQSEVAKHAAQVQSAISEHVGNFVTHTLASELAVATSKLESVGQQVASGATTAAHTVASGVEHAGHVIETGVSNAAHSIKCWFDHQENCQ
ncbi:Hypothetical predicted protein [Lecanosticta acicola]|uniref:Uncharacterized protein n=1 Tax=Lecanosticta acicola TaxID=111012 RepID=A0AAI9EB89_9PEZI|nr:Hypothetical predicted protein [Lecanosticta acicola]